MIYIYTQVFRLNLKNNTLKHFERKHKSKLNSKTPQSSVLAQETFMSLFTKSIGQERCQADKFTDVQEQSLLLRKAELKEKKLQRQQILPSDQGS